MDRDPQTLLRWLMDSQLALKQSKTDLYLILSNLQLACKVIANAIARAGMFDLYGAMGTENTSGDKVKKLDVFSNDVFINCMRSAGNVAIMASEENDKAILFESARDGKYAVVFDPLDGSSNIDANVTTGTIFGIYNVKKVGSPSVEDLLQPGNELVCAGYVMYSSACILVISFGKDTWGFTLDPSIGEFILTYPHIRIPRTGNVYSVNLGYSLLWNRAVSEWVDSMKARSKKARWIACMVGDIHRTLLYGGSFAWPSDKVHKSGKLRLVYELNPMAFIIEAAGGTATTGTERILDLKPDGIHARRPIILGSVNDVYELCDLYIKYGLQGVPKDSDDSCDVKSNNLTIE